MPHITLDGIPMLIATVLPYSRPHLLSSHVRNNGIVNGLGLCEHLTNTPPPHRCAPRRSARRIHHRLSAVIISSKASQFTECTSTSHAMSPLTSTRLHKFVCRTHSYRYRGYIHDVSTGGTSMKTQAKIARCAALGVPQNMVCCMHIRSCEFPISAQHIYICVCWMDTEQCVLSTQHHRAFIIGAPCVYIYIYIRRYPPMSATTPPANRSSTESLTGATTVSGDVSSYIAWSNKRRFVMH